MRLNSWAPRRILLSWPAEQLKAFSRAPAFPIACVHICLCASITPFLGTPVYQALPDDLRGMNLTAEVSKRGDVHFLRGKGVPGGFWMENVFSAVRPMACYYIEGGEKPKVPFSSMVFMLQAQGSLRNCLAGKGFKTIRLCCNVPSRLDRKTEVRKSGSGKAVGKSVQILQGRVLRSRTLWHAEVI